jgi:SAM-dependent methyltransferase
MTYPDFEYYGLMAQTWDLLRGDTSNWADRRRYLALIAESGQPVLDVGCGTGRLLLDYRQQGIDIDGMDNSPDMLALLHARAADLGLAVTALQQTMQTLDMPRRYRTILVPSSSFQLLLTPQDAAEAMRRFYAHLLPGGALIMSLYLDYLDGMPDSPPEWSLTGEKTRPSDGALLRRWSRGWLDPADGLEHTEDCYEVLVEGKVVQDELHRRSPATKFYTQEQARAVYAAAGFERIQFFKEFTAQPAGPGDNLFTALGFRPAA